MEDKHIFYDYEGRTLKIPVSERENFEKDVPSAKMLLTYDGHNLAVPLSELKSFAKDVGKENISYSVYNDKNEYVPEASTDKYLSFEGPSLGESVAKATGSTGVRTGKRMLNLLHTLSAGTLYNDPETGAAKRLEDIDTQLKDETNTFRNASILAGETADRLSREADPTGGQEGFVDLMAKGQIGKALQKGVVTTIESLPQTLSAYNPITMGLNAAAMAAENYVESTLDNPEMEKWKRATYAVGTAAFEQAVEKFADPLFKYIGGGKAAKGLTEEAAKKLIDDVTRQATDDMAKRIFAGLGKIGLNVAKDAGGEGLEEVITSFGNDALGEALDAIDGDKDFGIRAQWQKMKEENPDADMWDFAKAKAKVYADAFIGGALSGGMMSGPTQLITGGANMVHKEVAIRTIENSRELGSKLDLNNMYDMNEKVNETLAKTSEAFAGEEDKPAISSDFFANLSADEAFALSESEDITAEQKSALENLANVKAAQEGLDEKLDNRINEKINSITAIVNDATEDGSLVTGRYNGNAIFVKGGVVRDGKVTLPDGSNGPVIIINETTGEKTTVQSNEIENAESVEAEGYSNGMAQMYRDLDQKTREDARNTMSIFAKQREVMPFVNKKILVNLGNGPVEVYVQQITDNGEVTLKGKKGDLGGQSIITLNAGTFYDSIHRDDTGNPVITEVKEGEVEEQPVEPETKPEAAEVAPSGQQDYREQVVTILINGKPVQVEVTGQDNTADRITYEYTDENGVRRSGGSSIADFESAITTPIETAPEVEPEIPTEEPVAKVEPEAPAEVPITPEVINWDALLETEPEAYFAEMQKRFGDKTANRINAVISVLQKEIDSLNKVNPKTQEEIFENEDRKEALQAKIDSLNGMIERLNAPTETAPETTSEPVEEAPASETPVEEEPAPVEAAPIVEETPVETEPVAETPVVEPTQEPVIEEPISSVPVAPNPVANPVEEALKREESLIPQLERKDIGKNQRRDMAYNAGKAIADMFATREEYEAYESIASDLGEFNDDFERGVNDSFANRNQTQNIGESDGNSVPLGTEPNGEQDGRQSEQTDGEDTIRQGDDTVGRGSDDGGVETTNTGDKETEQELGKGESETVEEVKKEYPARKGNATKKILIDTFGFSKVSIPNTESTVLNTVYDFMMEMAKMLGVSPNVIGNGGWLDVANLRSNANASAAYSWKNRPDGEVVEPRLRLKYGRISSIAHEWWHSLDHVLKFFNTSKGRSTATANISLLDSFGVRKEVQMALADLLKAMKDSGFEHRIASMRLPFKYKYYLLENEEMTARAFDAYINDKFESAGIEVENAVYEKTPYQPTPEEMEVIAPAFDNLFKVLKEKEGKKAGTSVLYHIGASLDNNSDAKKFATESVLKILAESGIDVSKVTDEQVTEMLRVRAELSNAPFELMTVFHGSGNKFDKFDHSHMGEGEGAQAHGWGTYVAVDSTTSKSYAEQIGGGSQVLMNGNDVTDVARSLVYDPQSYVAYLISLLKSYGDGNKVREHILGSIEEEKAYIDFFKDDKHNKSSYEHSVAELEKLEKALELYDSNTWSIEERKSQLYTVEIPEDNGSNYLYETGYTDNQIEKISDACDKEGIDFIEVAAIASEMSDKRDGARLYKALINVLGSDKAASEFLSRAGFIGIKYSGRVDGDCFVIFNENDAKITGRTEFYQTPNGTVYGWTDGKKIYLTEAGINPNTPVHEYTHLWAKAMMQKNPKGWNSVKNLLKGTPVWSEVLSDSNYSNIHNDEDAVASEVLSRISGPKNALKLEQMAQQMIDEAKGAMRKLEAQGLIQRIKDALNEFWNWVGVELFGIENFESIEQVTDRVLWDLMNNTDLGGSLNNRIDRTRRDNESAIEFTESIISECKSKYNPLCETDVYPVDNTIAARFGYTLEELNNTDGLYEHTDVSDLIAIFAHERTNSGLIVENIFFHENIHYLSRDNKKLLEFGQWLFDNSYLHPILNEYRLHVISKYSNDRYATEMLSYTISYFMSTGTSETFDKLLPNEYQDLVKEIENKIGYDRTAEKSVRRADENIQLSIGSEDISVPQGESDERGSSIEDGIADASQINTLNNNVAPTDIAQETAKQTYDRVINERWQEFQRQFQDAYQPVRIALDAIQNETGNIPIEYYENYLLIQNLSSSRSRVEIDTFSRRFYSPIIDQTNKIISQILESRGLDIENKENRAAVYQEVVRYLIAKHGLERNEYYQTHKKRRMTAAEMRPLLDEVQREYEEKVNQINADTTLSEAERKLQLREAADELNALVADINTREVPDMRDYSGLTSLYGLDSKEFEEAERMAKEDVEKFEALAPTEDLWKRINAATNKTLKHSYESGMLSRKQYEEISKMFEFYIPLRGFDENTAEDIYAYARFEGNRFNPAVHKAKGRTSLADDPIATIMNMAESEIAQGNKNKAKQALYNYILNRPIIGADGKQMQNTLMQVEDVWYVVSKDENGNDIHQIAAPDHEGGETYEAFENRMKALAKDGKAYKSKKGGVDVGVRFQKPANRNAHYVYLKINGVDKAIYINGDPKAADAINGTYKQKPLPKAKIKIGDREISVDLGAVQRNISSTFTNYSLEFTARNFFRDMFYSHINIDIKESDPEYRKKFRQNWRNNIFSMLPMLKAYRAGEFDNRALTEDEAAFVEFMENGGQTGYTVINSVEARKIELENAIKRMQEGVEKGGLKDSTIFKATLGGVELLNEASELITRFAAYKTSRDMGRSVVKSINDAKEITVNFNTKGAQDGTGIFGKAAQYLGWSKYFFNASVQGVQNITAMAKADKLKFCTTVGTIMATGFMMPVLVAAISAILGGDDEDEYWNIPEYDRQNNLCIPIGGTYVKLPLPIGFREMYAMGDMIAAMAFDKKFSRNAQQVGMDMANKVASIVLPINPLEGSVNGLNIWASIGTILAPSSAQFLIQNATNTDWKGAPLQKEYTYNENDPQWMKAYASNPLWMKSLSKWCNETLGTGDMKGVDWSPEKLDNTLSNLFGGVYTLTKKLGKTLSMAWNEDNRKMSNVPLAGVVLGTGINSDDAFVTDAYFEMKEYYDDRIGFIKKRAEKFGYDLDEVFLKGKGKHHPKMQDIYNNKTFDFMQEWYKGNEELKELQKAVKKIEKQIAEKEKPSEALINKLLKAKMELDIERREFVNDMLEFD